MEHPAFRSGQYDTHFVQNYYDKREKSEGVDSVVVNALISALIHRNGTGKNTPDHPGERGGSDNSPHSMDRDGAGWWRGRK